MILQLRCSSVPLTLCVTSQKRLIPIDREHPYLLLMCLRVSGILELHALEHVRTPARLIRFTKSHIAASEPSHFESEGGIQLESSEIVAGRAFELK